MGLIVTLIMNATVFHYFSHAHTKIPTLYEAIDVVIKEQDMYMLLEIKDSSSKVRILYIVINSLFLSTSYRLLILLPNFSRVILFCMKRLL